MVLDWIHTRGQAPSKERHLREPRALPDARAAEVVAGRAVALRRYFVLRLKGDLLVDRASQAFDAREADCAISHERVRRPRV